MRSKVDPKATPFVIKIFEKLIPKPFVLQVQRLNRQIELANLRQQYSEIITGLSDEEKADARASLTRFWELLTPLELASAEKTRVGGNRDGGYVVASDIENISGGVSLGIGSHLTIEKELIQKLGIRISGFDHTISQLPVEIEGFTWHRVGCGSGPDLLPLSRIVEISTPGSNAI